MYKLLLSLCFVGLALAGPGFRSLKNPGTKIVGGDETTIEDFPWQVSFRYYDIHFCGASIIDENTILTAAHCTDGLRASRMTVMVGSSNVSDTEAEVYQVKEANQHMLYNDTTFNYDICILKLERPLTFSKYVRPIPLQDEYVDVKEGTVATVSGWGAIKQGDEDSPDMLRKTDVDVITKDACQDAYKFHRITRSMLCAWRAGHDSCQGDSGGPLVANGKLIGVVSWGAGCAKKYPGVYTSVAQLRGWIEANK